MWKRIIAIAVVSFFAFGCESSAQVEHDQQELGTQSLLKNQPVPDLGGWSFERHVVIETYKARNRTIATWTYQETFDGKFIEVCASIGFPIPYSTQLTNPSQYAGNGATVGNPEPNGLYSPSDAAATLVNCVNPDGSTTPTYWEPNVVAFPYRIKSDRQIERFDNKAPSLSIDTTQGK